MVYSTNFIDIFISEHNCTLFLHHYEQGWKNTSEVWLWFCFMSTIHDLKGLIFRKALQLALLNHRELFKRCLDPWAWHALRWNYGYRVIKRALHIVHGPIRKTVVRVLGSCAKPNYELNIKSCDQLKSKKVIQTLPTVALVLRWRHTFSFQCQLKQTSNKTILIIMNISKSPLL